MSFDNTIATMKGLLIPKLAHIVEMMQQETNPLLIDIPDDASHLSEDTISELIAKTNNSVNKAAEWLGAAYSAFKLTEHLYDLAFKRALRNSGKNEDERTAIAMEEAAEERKRLVVAESCYRYISAIYTACEINSQSARKLVDNFQSMRKADSRDVSYGKPAQAARV